MTEPEDLRRLRQEYSLRSQRLASSDRYSLFDRANLFTIQQRQRAALSLLRRAGFSGLQDSTILELGCGSGNVLWEYLAFGASVSQLYGVDLLQERVFRARQQFPGLSLACADGCHLPFESRQFDLVLGYTVFSSILDGEIRQALAREMLRVLDPDHGMILWYDFWLNPTNPQTRGIRPREVRDLFPGCTFHFQRVTLAPPLARRLVPVSWLAAGLLEKLRIFNSHYLAAIRPGLQK